MTSRRPIAIPRAVDMVLLIECLLAVITICSSYFVMGPTSAAFIIAVSAVGNMATLSPPTCC